MTSLTNSQVQQLEKNRKIIQNFYGGERRPEFHNFDDRSGLCEVCNTHIRNATSRLCDIITRDEVDQMRVNFDHNGNDMGW